MIITPADGGEAADVPAATPRRRPVAPWLYKAAAPATDFLVFHGAALLAWLVMGPAGEPAWPFAAATATVSWLAAPVLAAFRCYDEERLFARRARLRRPCLAWAVYFLVLLVFARALKVGLFAGPWTGLWCALSLAGLIAVRLGWAALIGRLADRGRVAQRTVIVGAGEVGRRLAAALAARADLRTDLLGFVDERQTRLDLDGASAPLLGPLAALEPLVRAGRVDQVFIALPWSAEQRIMQIVQRLAVFPVRVALVPDLVGYHYRDHPTSRVAGLPLLHLVERPVSGGDRVLKWLEDKLLAALLLVLLAPLMAVIAFAIRLDGAGPVVVVERRLGFGDRIIPVLRFRCRGRLGRFLHRRWLDELPQLLNVLKGDMSLVGPRPQRPPAGAETLPYAALIDASVARRRVRPGLTGWAEVNGWRDAGTPQDASLRRIELDLHYIENWSLGLDLRILLLTLIGRPRRGAYRAMQPEGSAAGSDR